MLLVACLAISPAHAQDTVCARVKLEIKQDLTLERQGFDAEMRINNTTDSGIIENVSVVVRVTDENGTPVPVTDNPNDLSARFFVRLSNKENIANVDGTGVVSPKTTGTVNWLLIPAPGAAGTGALGKKYLVGATLKYKFGAEETVLEVEPDVITVKPLPALTLDYFLTRDVVADDPLTPAIEATEPFTLGVRVKNNGMATAKNLKIDSAQPKIVENNQGLLVNFTLTGSYVNDTPATNSLLMNFGDIAGNTSKMGRWNMETTLAGKFTEFTARFTHADELGGALTSILQATNAHFLLRDVRVDLPGRDQVRDFLAQDGDVIRVYESDGADTEVTDRSAAATLTATTGSTNYRLAFPATAGFAYVKLRDPYNGTKVLGTIMRSDAKQLAPENVWLSRTRNEQSKQWEYWVNFFDVNTTGIYDSQFDAPPAGAQPPVMQFIPDRSVEEGRQVSFIVEASSPAAKPVTISAAPLPSGAKLTMQAADPKAPGLARAVFDWTPAPGSAGSYPISFSATDGSQSVQRTATIKVEAQALPAGPAVPAIVQPLSGATFVPAAAAFKVQPSLDPKDTGALVEFELYADEAMTELVASGSEFKQGAMDEGFLPGGVFVPASTTVDWNLFTPLKPGTRYWWRARTSDGNLNSSWAYAWFQTEAADHAPAAFNQTSPAPEAKVASLTPVLAWTNSGTKYGDPVTYSVTVYKDAAMTQVAAQASGLAEAPGGITSWTVQPALANSAKYYWRVVAMRAVGAQNVATPALPLVGAQTSSTPRAFTVDTGNAPPSVPVLLGPSAGVSTTTTPTLSVSASTDPEGDLVTYVFEIDRVKTFDSAAKRSSSQLMASGGSANWTTPALADNTRYWWRVKAQDAQGESPWAVGEFVASAANDAPAAPAVKNPGKGAWTSSTQPSLEAFAVLDPEGDSVRYQFEVYKDAGLTQKAAEGTSPNTSLIVPVPLAAKSWYWWRVRALDGANAASAWSQPASLYVGSGPAQGPSIALTSPSFKTVPVQDGTRKLVTIGWEGLDQNRDPSVALYYGTAPGSYAGTLIAEGLRQPSGAKGGSHVWDVSALAPGVYHVYAVAYDTQGTGKAYAPGAVVIPNAAQAGTLKIAGPAVWYEGSTGTLSASWDGAAAKSMQMPVFGNGLATALPAPATTANGSRAISHVYPYQCSTGATSFQAQLGPVITEDLNFAGRVATGGTGNIVYAASNTGDDSLRVCEIRILSSRDIDSANAEYTVTARLSNLGAGLSAATVLPISNMSDVTVVSGTLSYGVIGPKETGSTESVVTIRTQRGPAGIAKILLKGLRWSVQLTR